MALTDDQKRALTTAINTHDYEAFAMNLITGQDSDDKKEAVANFIEKLSIADHQAALNKLDQIASVVEQNSNGTAAHLESVLMNSFPEASSKTGVPNAPPVHADGSGIAAEENMNNMSLDDINDLLEKTKSEQALLIRTNKPLDPEKSELIKKLQAAKSKKESAGASQSDADAGNDKGGWYNLSSSQELKEVMDFELCEGTVILARIKEHLDEESKSGHISLSPQENIRKRQEEDFINKYKFDMTDLTSGDEFVKEVDQTFVKYRKITPHIFATRGVVKHSGCFPVAGGWVTILKKTSKDKKTPEYLIIPQGVSEKAYYTVKIARRYEGGNFYPGSFDCFEFKGNACISFVYSSKGVNALDEKHESLLKNQVNGYQKTFAEVLKQFPEDVSDLKPKTSGRQAFLQAAKNVDENLEESNVLSLSDPVNTDHGAAANTGGSQQAQPAQPQPAQSESKNSLAGQTIPSGPDVEEDNKEDMQEADTFDSNDSVDKKIQSLEKLLEKAKFSKQESTIKRLEADIARLKSEKASGGGDAAAQQPQQAAPQPAQQQQSQETAPTAQEEAEPNLSPEEEEAHAKEVSEQVTKLLSESGFSKDLQKLIHETLGAYIDFEKMTQEEAKKLLKKYFLSYNYEDLIKFRNKIVNDPDKLDIVGVFDQYMMIYIELAYIAGDYANIGNKKLQELEQRSNGIVDKQDEYLEDIKKYNKKDLTAKELKEKQAIQEKIDGLQKEGNKITVEINQAQLLMSGDIAEIEKSLPDCEHLKYRDAAGSSEESEKDKVIKDYKTKLDKVGEKISQKTKKKFKLKKGDISHEAIDKVDVRKLSAEDIAEIAVAAGEPVELGDKRKAENVLKLVDEVKKFDKYLGSFFKNVEKHKRHLHKIQKILDKIQNEIIKAEENSDLIKIANKVKLTPLQEKKRLVEEKITHLKEQDNKRAKEAQKKLKQELNELETREKYLSSELDKSHIKVEKTVEKLKHKLQTQVNKYHDEQSKLIGVIYKLSPDSLDYAQDLHDHIIDLCKQYPVFYGQLVRDGLLKNDPRDDEEDETISDDDAVTDQGSESEEDDYADENDESYDEPEDEPEENSEEEEHNDNGQPIHGAVPEPLEPEPEDELEDEDEPEEDEADDEGDDSSSKEPAEATAQPSQQPKESENDASQPKDLQLSMKMQSDAQSATPRHEEQADQAPAPQQPQQQASPPQQQASSPQQAPDDADEATNPVEVSDEENKILDQVYEEVQKILVNRETVHSIESARETIQPERFEYASKLDRVKMQSEINYATEDLKSEAAEVAAEYDDVVSKFMEDNHEALMQNAKNPDKLAGPSNEEVVSAIDKVLKSLNENVDEITKDLLMSCCKTEFRIQSEAIQAIVPALQSGQSVDEIVSKLAEVQKIDAEKLKKLVDDTAKILGMATQ
ncbi:MAG: hypothetical protein RLN62_05465 [Rickettsiales bacterium]